MCSCCMRWLFLTDYVGPGFTISLPLLTGQIFWEPSSLSMMRSLQMQEQGLVNLVQPGDWVQDKSPLESLLATIL